MKELNAVRIVVEGQMDTLDSCRITLRFRDKKPQHNPKGAGVMDS